MLIDHSLTSQIRNFQTGINHGCSKNLMDLNEWIERYTSIWWYRMVKLDQNEFYNLSKCYWLGNDTNGLITKYALKNIFIDKYISLDLFILMININIHLKAYKPSKKKISEKRSISTKNIGSAKGKKIKKFKSCNKCIIKGWYQFVIMFLLTS